MSNDDITTKPTLETVLDRINTLGERLESRIDGLESKMAGFELRVEERFNEVDKGFAKIDERLNEVESGFDKVEAQTLRTRLELVDMRSDFREWRAQLKPFLPPPAQPST